MYGLKQAPRAWFQWFSDYLLELGFQESKCDYSLFVFNQNGVYLLLLINVDDILVIGNDQSQTGNDQSQISLLIQRLGTHFSIKDLGPLHYFLGVEVDYNEDSMHLLSPSMLWICCLALNLQTPSLFPHLHLVVRS